MIFSVASIGIGALLSALPVSAAPNTCSHSKVFDSTNFFSGFNFEDAPDASGGFVDYVDGATANNTGLAKISNGAVYLGSDYETVTTVGRPAVRVRSKDAFTTGLFISDISHMPAGTGKGASCGIWPAYWTVGANWPNDGEIDIIEGVNNQAANGITLHTAKGCNMDVSGSEATSEQTGADCEANNAGCTQSTTSTNNYGDGFNANGGGVYAVEWTTESISAWFFPRGSDMATQLINGGTADVNVGILGNPLAHFKGNSCNISNNFKSHNIIFNIDYCGSWTSNNFKTDSVCKALAPTCNDWVGQNPAQFKDAYWLINSVRVYNKK
ncbi:Concanavalin A-like lectin/glucanase subgroup [Penicillium paradoxum]|uniref:Concanavalin A-like lectin/glucanase subgroup n=1 Tax=Penicillium paradoxum TaxID=176176 RepID=UPI0025474528|nr:Concanavalin A-like lectin/glucanase subgroup [Penicillium paradoxum]KAJ5780619.1 Concanavalin A-like lectin/glucanase subgroup [Penicillium paradoxum]